MARSSASASRKPCAGIRWSSRSISARAPAMLEVGPIDAFYGQSHILHGVALRLEEGARLSVLGRNGAGKSTLMKSIVNAGPKVRGEVRFRGRSLDGLQANQRSRLGLSLVPEDRRIFGHLTSLENLRVAQSGACTDR